MIAASILPIWLLGILSFAIFGSSIYLLRAWSLRAWNYDAALDRYLFVPDFGWNEQTALLLAALALLVWSLAGGLILRGLGGLFSRRQQEDNLPRNTREGVVQRITRPDGSELQVEVYGRAENPPLILTHGWGLNSTEWIYVKQELTTQFQLIVWDLPGLGLSKRPQNGDYSLEKLACDLEAVLGVAGKQPALLVGHSIGGMITLTFCRLFPKMLGSRVKGLGLVHTTYTNPVRTVIFARLMTALERPLLIPLLYLTIWLSPLVWLMNWMSYLNGSSHILTKVTGFAGTETWEQVDFATRFQLQAPPAVLARGMLGMIHYDATATLRKISVPTLVVPGDRDPICKPEASVVIEQEISEAQLVALAPAKHMGLLEHHADFAATIADFARSCFQDEKTKTTTPRKPKQAARSPRK